MFRKLIVVGISDSMWWFVWHKLISTEVDTIFITFVHEMNMQFLSHFRIAYNMTIQFALSVMPCVLSDYLQ